MQPQRTFPVTSLPQPKSVLIAEDNRDLRAIFTRTFVSMNFNVETASDGQEALDWLTLRVPDILVLDVNMPHVSGLQVLKYVRENSRLSGLKVIIVTGNSTVSNTPEADCADLVLLKPVSIFELVTFAQRLVVPTTYTLQRD